MRLILNFTAIVIHFSRGKIAKTNKRNMGKKPKKKNNKRNQKRHRCINYPSWASIDVPRRISSFFLWSQIDLMIELDIFVSPTSVECSTHFDLCKLQQRYRNDLNSKFISTDLDKIG